jgi:hypothetical protein
MSTHLTLLLIIGIPSLGIAAYGIVDRLCEHREIMDRRRNPICNCECESDTDSLDNWPED